ncbi:hypothetical protein PLUTE_a2364 [Pseudoalteromonas luteoviolacea DSM 6061]|nr:hypothetical protein [Pseudoalteromonas luteoviolacea DSM 6061]
MKVGHCQAPNKRKPDSKESGFFAFKFKSCFSATLAQGEESNFHR